MKIALVGNPNTGKTSLFNRLTGLNQKVGNYPGVTVDKKAGHFNLPNGEKVELIDLPGTYSLHATSRDEEIVTEALADYDFKDHPDVVIVVADATNLKRNLLLFTQVSDLNLPCMLVLNMIDEAEKKGVQVDVEGLQKELKVPIVKMNARKGVGIEALKNSLQSDFDTKREPIFNINGMYRPFVDSAKEILQLPSEYNVWLRSISAVRDLLDKTIQDELNAALKQHKVVPKRAQIKETVDRYKYIETLLERFVQKDKRAFTGNTDKLDRLFTHKLWGFVIFFGILALIFQAIFSWSTWPMDWIEKFFSVLSAWVTGILPEGPVVELLADGIIPGLAGVLVFIPQIAILFAFIAILEETGYMSRVVFIMDKLMQKFGLNGRSVVPLLSGMACSIPAIMATRSIQNWKERLTTILVTPFMTCSARLPVYTILIALVIPPTKYFGFLSLQGLVLMALYAFGFVMAIASAMVFDKILKTSHKGYLIMEMPAYKLPQGRNVGLTILEKVKSFVFNAGRIIVAISIILWVLARYGPVERKEMAQAAVIQQAASEAWSQQELDTKLAASDLQNSYIGIFGKAIEPAIDPLGYDWKMGIALISSFAAREVFVGTMATIYAVGDPDNEKSIKAQMAADINPLTGKKTFTFAVAMSLLVFYALAMQCMSTLAVVYRETKGWKWPIIQFVFMTGLAYVLSLVTYQLLK